MLRVSLTKSEMLQRRGRSCPYLCLLTSSQQLTRTGCQQQLTCPISSGRPKTEDGRRTGCEIAREIRGLPLAGGAAVAGSREPITAGSAEFLRKHIKALPKGSTWLFPKVASKCDRSISVRRAHRRAIKAAGLDPDVIIRRTFQHTAITLGSGTR